VTTLPTGRLVVLSPHLDDAILSLGATIAQAAQRGTDVLVLTVFAGDPKSTTAAGSWDDKAGFDSFGEAARGRREEDRIACARVGATPAWLPFADAQYEPELDEDRIWEEIVEAVEGATAVLMPGFPLVHPDHARLTKLVLRLGVPNARLALYAEQPYVWRLGERPTLHGELTDLVSEPLVWRTAQGGVRARHAKRRGVLAYRSQLGLFGRQPVRRMALYELLRGGEQIAWLSEAPGPQSREACLVAP
jgi:LmbE family N-acetylglucosaminyl deacetylase